MMLLRLIFVFILQFVFIKEVITANLECYTTYDKGASYNGTVTQTRGGLKCLNWATVTNNVPNYYENHNYCRNPFKLEQPWCYTDRTIYAYDFCDIPTCGCRQSTADLLYNGHVGVTRNGHACNVWDGYKNLPASNDGFCRTPNGDGDNDGGPWCYFSKTPQNWDRCNVPVCNGMVCPDLSNHHLEALDGKARYQYGESVIVHCKDGYTMTSGQIHLTCLHSGRWNDSLPICEGVVCPDLSYHHLEALDGKARYQYGESVIVHCKDGYTMTSGQIHLTCLNSGRWNDTLPRCEDITCQPIKIPTSGNVEIKPKRISYVVNSSVTLSCKYGYSGNDVHSLCKANGKWFTEQLPICKLITCQPVKIPPSGNIEVKPIRISYDFNSNLTISCKYGYSGDDVHSLCKANGKWSTEQLPLCKLITCQPIKILTSGSVEIKPIRISYVVDSSVTLSCKTGYSGVDEQSVCKANEKWSSENLPICIPVPCSALNKTQHMVIPTNISGYHYGDNVTFQCVNGYNLSGPSLIICRSSTNRSRGEWSDEQPTCEEKSDLKKDCMERRVICLSYGAFGGMLTAIAFISAVVHVGTCFYHRKQVGKPVIEYEDMQFNTVQTQNSSNEDTYTELT